MTDLLAYLAGRAGLTTAQLQQTTVEVGGQGRKYSAVPKSPELERILSLPRRDPRDGIERLIADLTDAFRRPGGTQTLRAVQALAVAEMWTRGGALLPIMPGGGKTLIAYLAPAVFESKRPLLVVPAKLRDETYRKHRALYEHWLGPHPDEYRIESYEFLGHPGQGVITDGDRVVQDDFLSRYRPDLVVLDEAHKTKNVGGVLRKRFRRHWQQAPTCRRVAMSGTFAAIGLRDYAHIAQWCLGQGSPLPVVYSTLEDWADALDNKVIEALRPGELLRLCNDEEREHARGGLEAETTAARWGFRRRLKESPGVIVSLDERPSMDLVLDALTPAGAGDPALEPCFRKLKDLMLTPTDEPVPDHKERWRHERELSLGLHYRWDPPPPREWVETRRAACGWLRPTLAYCARYRPHIDSEAKVWAAVEQGQLDDGGLLAAWRAVEPTFVPNPVPVWHSREALDAALGWLAGHDKGVVWVEHRFFAERLAREAGVPYFGAEGKDAQGRFILDWKGPCVASIRANGEGRDMQPWDSGLIMTFPQGPVAAEQLLARQHREGQTAKCVTFTVWLGSYLLLEGLYKAVAGAQANADREGGLHRLLYAAKRLPGLAELAQKGGARWTP